MKHYIKENLREIALSLVISLIAVACYVILKAKGIIVITCPAHYLNPWQYFFYCELFNALIYLAIAVPIFMIAFVIIRKSRLI